MGNSVTVETKQIKFKAALAEAPNEQQDVYWVPEVRGTVRLSHTEAEHRKSSSAGDSAPPSAPSPQFPNLPCSAAAVRYEFNSSTLLIYKHSLHDEAPLVHLSIAHLDPPDRSRLTAALVSMLVLTGVSVDGFLHEPWADKAVAIEMLGPQFATVVIAPDATGAELRAHIANRPVMHTSTSASLAAVCCRFVVNVASGQVMILGETQNEDGLVLLNGLFAGVDKAAEAARLMALAQEHGCAVDIVEHAPLVTQRLKAIADVSLLEPSSSPVAQGTASRTAAGGWPTGDFELAPADFPGCRLEYTVSKVHGDPTAIVAVRLANGSPHQRFRVVEAVAGSDSGPYLVPSSALSMTLSLAFLVPGHGVPQTPMSFKLVDEERSIAGIQHVAGRFRLCPTQWPGSAQLDMHQHQLGIDQRGRACFTYSSAHNYTSNHFTLYSVVGTSSAGSLRMPDGASYVGGVSGADVPHGHGTMSTAEGATLCGQWRDGVFIDGMLRAASGGLYFGEVHDGLPHGPGMTVEPSGKRVVAMFENGKASRRGTAPRVVVEPGSKHFVQKFAAGPTSLVPSIQPPSGGAVNLADDSVSLGWEADDLSRSSAGDAARGIEAEIQRRRDEETAERERMALILRETAAYQQSKEARERRGHERCRREEEFFWGKSIYGSKPSTT